MLAPADATLVRRDPQLPGLATLLDPEQVRAQVQQYCPHLSINRLTPTYVRYKPGTNCLVGYELATADGVQQLYGITFAQDEAAKLAKLAQLPPRAAPATRAVSGEHELPGFLRSADQQVSFCFFPHDRRLKGLIKLYGNNEEEQQRRHKLLRRLLPHQRAGWQGTLTPLRYKPERRYVARVSTAAGPVATLRCYSKATFATAIANQRACAAHPELGFPPLLGTVEQDQMLALGWLAGTGLDQLLLLPSVGPGPLPPPTTAAIAGVRAAGAALARFHQSQPALTTRYTIAAESEALQAAAASVITLLPALHAPVTALVAQLTAALASTSFPWRPLHGDFSADQILLCKAATGQLDSSPAVALLDLDRAGYGNPAADLGAFLAGLDQAVVRGILPAAHLPPLTTALLAGYTDATPTPPAPAQVTLHRAIRLLRLAGEPFRQRWSPLWPTAVAATVQRVGTILKDKERLC